MPGFSFVILMGNFINHNGKIIKKSSWKLSPDNRSFRYGDGCFETIHLVDNKIILNSYHFERLFFSLEILKFKRSPNLTSHKLGQEIIELALQNGHEDHARIRLTFYRGEGGLYEDIIHTPNYLIQTWKLEQTTRELNESGLVVDIYQEARKSCDKFSSIKSNNFLCYAMAAIWAKQQRLNDCILLNAFENVADATVANIFIVRDGTVYTPPLTDGCINGVMRRHILKSLEEGGMPCKQLSISKADILQASEVFFTNAIYGIRWVRQVGKINYQNQLSKFLHEKYIKALFI